MADAVAGVRQASHRDLDRVTELWIALGEHHAALEPAFALRAGAAEAARRILAAQLADPDTAILVHDDTGALAGLLIVRIARAPDMQVERCRGEITDLFVREPARRRGIGRALAEAGVAWARERGAERVEVRIASANPAANAFWRASGFAPFVDVLHRHLEISGPPRVEEAMPPAAKLNPLAVELNERIEAAAPEVAAMLSALGRRLYFPKGILSQSAEAKQKAHRMNATIGIATEGGAPMFLPSIAAHLRDVSPAEAFDYAPPAGQPALRARWREKMLAENPSLRGKAFSLPIVTAAITHGLSLVGDLFLDPGDLLLLPDKLWGNYRLTYSVRLGAEIATFPLYAGEGFACAAFAEALERSARGRDKLAVLLNFPNNPTGYMPTEAEGQAIASALIAQAERGTRLVTIFDDAYFGLFYHLGGPSMTESLFGRVANAHPNLLAIRTDGATKELFVWGLRCGFLTFAPGRADTATAVCDALDAKVRGAIRSGISNSPQLSQTLVAKALATASIDDERKQKGETLRARAERAYTAARAPRYRESWNVYPFNSGYFMCIETKGVAAEQLRLHLLDAYGIGTIAAGEADLRIAFSCLELDQIEPLFETLHRAIQELV